MKTILVALLFPIFLTSALATDQKHEEQVRQTLNQFIQAFDNLDLDRFISFFADDATIFQPRKFLRRADRRPNAAAIYEFASA